jgi:hypothetical protein
MKSLTRDTSPEAQKAILQLLRDTPTSRKLLLTFDLIQTTRLLVLAGLRQRFPNDSESQLRQRLISKLLPREHIMRAYGFDPDH